MSCAEGFVFWSVLIGARLDMLIVALQIFLFRSFTVCIPRVQCMFYSFAWLPAHCRTYHMGLIHDVLWHGGLHIFLFCFFFALA